MKPMKYIASMIECLKQKALKVSNIVGMGFEKHFRYKTEVQAQIKRLHHILYLCTVTVT